MLPKINRIKKKKDFEIIFKNSKSFKNKLFILRAKKNNLDLCRVGLIVSQKVSKKAVVRNKIRRRLSKLLSERLKNIELGTDIIFIALSGIEKKEFQEIREGVDNILAKANV